MKCNNQLFELNIEFTVNPCIYFDLRRGTFIKTIDIISILLKDELINKTIKTINAYKTMAMCSLIHI